MSLSGGHLYRIVVVGGGGVGKSCLTLQFVANRFVEDYDPTLEDSYRRQVNAGGQPCVVEILDTAGQDDYALIREAYYQTGDGFVFVFDVTQSTSFFEVLSLYEAVLRANDKLSVPAILVGNKTDLVSKRQVTRRQGEELARRLGCKYVETTAKESDQVNEVFYGILLAVNEERKREKLRLSLLSKSLDEPGFLDGTEELQAGGSMRGERKRRNTKTKKAPAKWGRKRSIIKQKVNSSCSVM